MIFKWNIISTVVHVFLPLIIFFNAYTSIVDAQYRIVGGIDVGDDENIPYQISLQITRRDGSSYKHFCGGSILSPKTILTAAHCVKDLPASALSVLAGVRDLNATGQRSQVIGYKIHPNYKELVTGDVAILYISPELKLDGIKVDKIDVVSQKNIGGGKTLMLTGWGSINPVIAVYPLRLQKLIYKSITNAECKPVMSNLTKGELCAHELSEGSCVGDSGGPLVMRKGEGFLQVGIVSYGSKVCANELPDVYTRVSTFADWIVRHIGKEL